MSTLTSRPRARSRASQVTSPRSPLERPNTLPRFRTPTDHIDSAVVDEDDHHPLDAHAEHDEHDVEEDRRSERSSQTAVQNATGRAEQFGGDAEKGLRSGVPASKTKSRQSGKAAQDPETREWKDDIVTFDSVDDPANPKNFTTSQKIKCIMLYGSMTACSTFASSVFSSASTFIQEDFGINQETAILGVSLFVLGYVPGPLLFAPISEIYGRKASILLPVFIFICFSAATATATNIQTIFITRFFAGVFASAPVTNVGGVLADLYDQRERGTAVVFYSLAVVAGPTLGPIIGAAVSQNASLGWRWTEYLVVILTSAVVVLVAFFVPETFAPVLLAQKASKLRMKTGRWALHSRHEMTEKSLDVFLHKHLFLPVKMILTEPLVTVLTIYNSFAYAILYMLFAAIPIVYEENRGWNVLVGALPFLAVMVGTFIAAAINIAYSQLYFQKYLDAHGGSCPPELRLPPMMIGAILFPVGFFIVGWTSKPEISWVPSVIGFAFIGTSFLLIFQAGLNMLIDSYTSRSASAVAANTFMRSFFAAGLPFAAPPLFNNLGVNWACTLLGCVAAVLGCVPFIFYKIGPTLRARSKLIDRKD